MDEESSRSLIEVEAGLDSNIGLGLFIGVDTEDKQFCIMALFLMLSFNVFIRWGRT